MTNHRSEIIDNVRDGILRWINHPENKWWLNAFTQNAEWQIFELCLPEALYLEMGAHWLCLGGWGQEHGSGEIVALWDEAILEVTNILCPGEADS